MANLVRLSYSHLTRSMASAVSPSPSAAFSPFRSPSSTSTSAHLASLATYAALPQRVEKSRRRFHHKGSRQVQKWQTRQDSDGVSITKSRSSAQNSESKTLISGTPSVGPSPLGLTPFFGFYNKTTYSGLATHILNSYTNPILQVMHDTLLVGKLVRLHIATNCTRAHCLSASSVSYYARRCTRDQLLIQQLLQDARSCSR